MSPSPDRSAASSPEFEFRRLSSAAPQLLSADELFLDGYILPLHRLPTPPPPVETISDDIPPPPASSLTSSKRWRDIFKSPEKKAAPTDINIKLWPFSRSRSAGTGVGGAAKDAAAKRVSSAPCSRSGSRREKEREVWRSSPGRVGGGVVIRRGSPVWRVRRGGKKAGRGAADQGKQFNLREFFARKLYL